MESISGIIEEIIYRNETNGYTVLTISTDDGLETCVGIMFKVVVGERLEARGRYSQHVTYGHQFIVDDFATTIPHELQGVERYLGSGIIKGIGPKLAKKMIDQFGERILDIMEKEPERLVEIKGISAKKAQDIGLQFLQQYTMRQSIIFLQSYQLSMTMALKIYNYYKEKTYQVVQQNPYRLAEDIYGIGFKVADRIAIQDGVADDNPERLKAAVQYVLNRALNDGHTYLPKDELITKVEAMIQLPLDYIDHVLLEMHLNKKIVIQKMESEASQNSLDKDEMGVNSQTSVPVEKIYLEHYYEMEQYIAFKYLECLSAEVPIFALNAELLHESDDEIVLDEGQRGIVKRALTESCLIITGGPGTGKTTLIHAVVQQFRQQGQVVALAAPTGRAAKRMTESTGVEAKTIHRLLENNYLGESHRQTFERNEEYPLECDVLIVDEASMMDVFLMYHLMKAVPLGVRLILVGDKNQLPSVGAGNVLRDLLAFSEQLPVVSLEKIFRQGEASGIVENAYAILHGEPLTYQTKKDFFLVKRRQQNQILTQLISLIQSRLPKFTGLDRMADMQVLTPMRKSLLGSNHLNKELQKVLNPPMKSKSEKKHRELIFREGDKVMQIKNNYQLEWSVKSAFGYRLDEGLGVFNGDIGIVEEINHFSETIRICLEGERQVDYPFALLDELDHAYALTVHKAQGSEYPLVIFPVFNGSPLLLTRHLFYTAVTRAKKYVVLVGDPVVIDKMVQNDKQMKRYSSLDYFLDKASHYIG